MPTSAKYEITTDQLIANAHAAARDHDHEGLQDLAHELIDRRSTTQVVDFGDHQCDDCPNPYDREIDFDWDGEPFSLIDDQDDAALYITDSLIHLHDVRATV